MSLVELKNVSFSYKVGSGHEGADANGYVPVLKDITLTIDPGELVAIQGPSGSGKSTFLYILGCLLRPNRGEIHIEGRNIARLSSEDLAILRNQTIGFIFQQFHLLPRATVRENILLPTIYPVEYSGTKAEDRNRADRLAEQLGLGARLGHQPNQLSGGQQQRVAIARALMRDTKLILADEPTGNLDSKTSAQTIELLKELNRQGKTVVIITHDPEIARQCPRILHIRDGRLTGESVGDRVGNSSHATGTPTSEADRHSRANSRTISRVTADITAAFDSLNTEANRTSGESMDSDSASESSGASLGLQNIGKAQAIDASWWKAAQGYLSMAFKLMPQALDNLRRNKTRSALTMLGIIIGVAAVLAMVTLGEFTKRRILDSYAELGVNTVTFYGDPNWQLKATDIVPVIFRAFDWERDLMPLHRIFPQIKRMSPTLMSWNSRATFGGLSVDQDVRVLGVNQDAIHITGRSLLYGRNFSRYHIENRSSVCLIGFEIGQRLFNNTSPIGKVLTIIGNQSSYGCRVIGVLASQTSNKEWSKPNQQVLVPFTFLQAVADQQWEAAIRDVLIELHDGSNIERTGKGIQMFFEKKYGKSGRFRVSSDSKLISQMKRFLNLFTVMLASIAMICLAVGGIGITNMMLVSVSERLKEIGLRKALGATDLSVRVQFLVESVILCCSAGLIGIVIGFVTYEGVIWGAARFVPSLKFEWVFEPGAIFLSLASIVFVGIASGLAPALKAEKLQVIEALRAE